MSAKPQKRSVPPRRKKAAGETSSSIFSDPPGLGHARALWQGNDRLQAIVLFDQTVKAFPANLPALVDASRAFGHLYQYRKATEYLQRAEELGAASAKAMFLIGQSYRILRRHDDAIRCFRAALTKNRSMSDAHLELAILFERRNELDNALDHCNARLKLMKTDGESAFLKGRILRRKDQLEEAAVLLTATAADRNTHLLTRSKCFAELALLHEQTGQYKKAWQVMTEGRSLQLPLVAAQRQHRDWIVSPMNLLSNSVSEKQFQKWYNERNNLTELVPRPILLTGLPRSGTTLLGQILDAHSDVKTADEYNLFSAIMFPSILEMRKPDELTPGDLDGITNDRLEHLRKQCVSMFVAAVPNSSQSKILIDKNPSLLPFITPYFRMFPTEKIIVTLRDPRDVLISCMMSYMPLNEFSVDFLELPSAVARVESDLEMWLNVRDKLPQDCWIEMRYESLVNGFESETQRLLSFLELPWSESVKNYRDAVGKSEVFSPSYVDVAKPIHNGSINRWKNYEEYLSPYLSRLETLAKKLSYDC